MISHVLMASDSFRNVGDGAGFIPDPITATSCMPRLSKSVDCNSQSALFVPYIKVNNEVFFNFTQKKSTTRYGHSYKRMTDCFLNPALASQRIAEVPASRHLLRGKPNRIELFVILCLLDGFSVKVLGGQLFIHISQVHFEVGKDTDRLAKDNLSTVF